MNINGKRVVVTGKIDGESRITAEDKLREHGALVQASVNKDTDLLVTGAKVGATKINKAAQLGVHVIDWHELWTGPLPPRPAAIAVPAEPTEATEAKLVDPMLAANGDMPAGDDWLFEIKWDGYRGVAHVDDHGGVSLQSRGFGTQYTEQFPAIVAELATLPRCILDGELVVLDENGASSFANSAGRKGEASYVVFDLLEVGDVDLRNSPLRVRREALKQLLEANPELKRIGVSPEHDDGTALLEAAQKHGMEGIVAKKRESVYREGSRNGDWIKIKIRLAQEFVVVAYSYGAGHWANTWGSLNLAVYDGDELVPCGSVGTGGSVAQREELRKRLVPFGEEFDRSKDGVIHVEPTVVVQVAFQHWTPDGSLWHPAYLGIRDDKRPEDVVREAT